MSRKWQVQLIVCCTVTFLSVSRCFALVPVVQNSVLTDVQEALLPEKIISEFMNSFSNDDDDDEICSKALLPFLLTKDRPDWTYRIIDAFGKINSGIFNGNLAAYGNYEECLDISTEKMNWTLDINGNQLSYEVPAFKGQYLLVTFLPNLPSENFKENSVNLQRHHGDYNLGLDDSVTSDFIYGMLLNAGIQLGVCIPSVCESNGFEAWINRRVYDVAKGGFNATVGEFHYVNEPRKVTAGDISAITVLVFIGLLAASGTFLDLINLPHNKQNNFGIKFLKCFSFYTNGKKLLNTKQSEGSINCINGIRFLSISWVVLGHEWYAGTLIPWENTFATKDVFADASMMMVMSGPLAVDTFFLMSGFLMSYLTLKEYDKKGFRLFDPLNGYIHRYIRLTPAYGLIMLVLTTLILHVGSGPQWARMEAQSELCEKYWWRNLLYINNMFDETSSCMGESWYLACDFQLFLMGPWICFFIWKFKKLGILLMMGILALFIAIPGYLTAINDWPMQNFTTIIGDGWMYGFYYRFYTRATPYIWGLILGYLCNKNPDIHRTKGRRKIPQVVIWLGWLVSFGLILTTTFGLVNYWPVDLSCATKQCFSASTAITWAMFGRLAWSMGVSWIIFACMNGYGGFINDFLSWPGFGPLARLTYTIYLIHLHIMFQFWFSADQPMHYDKYLIFVLFFGHFVITIMFATLASLLFEAPFIGLEKLVFGRKERNASEKPATNGHVNNGAILPKDEEANLPKDEEANCTKL